MIKNQQKGAKNLTNTIELEIALKRAGLSKKELAKGLGLSEMGLFRKINNLTEFKASEIKKIQTLLHLQDEVRDLIFFASNSD